jgi:hypothetical protein
MRVEPMDLFWEDGLFSLRAMAFVWLIILVFGFAINPVIQTSRERSASNEMTPSLLAPTK